MEEFKEILKDLIAETELSLRQLEEKSGVSAMQYSRYLRGSVPTIEIVLKIAKFFDCSLDYLFGLDKNKNNCKYKTYNYDISVFINRYLKLLKDNNLTNFKFAKSNFDESMFRHWKKGVIPRLDIIYKIARDLGGSIDNLIGRY